MNLKTHLELFIKTATVITVDALHKAIDPCLGDGWHFTPHNQAEAAAMGAGEYLFYTCERTLERPPALLAINQRTDDTFYVANVAPTETHRLSVNEYNAVLTNFYDHILVKLSPDFTVLLVSKS